MENKTRSLTLLFAAFGSGLCSIIYELLIATTASYFLGDSVMFFSLTIGIYMASMGIGTFLSKYISRDLLERFIQVEIALALLGGISVPVLYMAYGQGDLFIPCFLFLTTSIGLLIGFEVPFLTRLMEAYCQLKVNIANVLSFDYLGALIATIAFPFFLLPFFGVYQSSLLFGLVNIGIGFSVLFVFKEDIQEQNLFLKRLTIGSTFCLLLMVLFSGQCLKHWEQSLYEDRIIHAEHSRYQKIVLTKDREDIRLFLEGNLQFSSIDEYRYHEALIDIPMAVSPTPIKRVLLLGAGDGLAARNLLKYPSIKEIVLVDLDVRVIQLAQTNPYLVSLNERGLQSSKVHVKIDDAFKYIEKNKEPFDLIVADLPDPNNSALSRLYSKQFFKRVKQNLKPGGVFVTQATSPYFAPKAFWCIARSVQAGGFGHIYPYHAHVPSFGEWGFVLASDARLNLGKPSIRKETRFIDQENFPNFFAFDKDTLAKDVHINRIDQPILLDYYLKGWAYYK